MKKDFLVEIGTEELPPKALRSLMDAFADKLGAAVDEADLEHAAIHRYASPRRLAVHIEKLAARQADRTVRQKGPPLHIAFDDDGQPTPAAVAFAKKCGVEVGALGREKTGKGEWLSHESVVSGKTVSELMPELVEKALGALPVPRRMRWGAGNAEFVRPVHWVVMLHGSTLIEAQLLGVRSDKKSRGHRFHTSRPVSISSPGRYLQTLESKAFVIADFERRRQQIIDGVETEARRVGGSVVQGELLYDEVTALVEWPVPMAGRFDEKFLELPREVVISTLTGHQRYFPVADKAGNLLPHFITVANIESSDPAQVREGNERVIRPRLADAAFFWENDQRRSLADRQTSLQDVVYQRGLGSLHDKSARVASLAGWLAESLRANTADVQTAAELAKCDLVTGMVGEFPELQGTMGGYYARASGESAAVADAISEHYRPRFAGDALPASQTGQILAIADKLDTLAGVFVLGKKPSGNRDPFGLRRAALGVVRILIECSLDIELPLLILQAVTLQPDVNDATEVASELQGFISERLRRYFLDNDATLNTETFDAVKARTPKSLLDFQRRLQAVQAFLNLDEAASLAAANKRIANILRKTDIGSDGVIDAALFEDDAEGALHTALLEARTAVEPLLAERDYTAALRKLSTLRSAIDHYFDDVMVMSENESLRNNRLALLGNLRDLFLDIADISMLSIEQA